MFFITKLNSLYQKGVTGLSQDVMDAFMAYHWPGNIRELENLIERAYILESGEVLSPKSFPAELFKNMNTSLVQVPLTISDPIGEVRKKAVENIEKQYLTELLSFYKGRMKLSSEKAGITSRQLLKLLTKYGIEKNSFK
jgi:DNA-binding NtrC family response regulator